MRLIIGQLHIVVPAPTICGGARVMGAPGRWLPGGGMMRWHERETARPRPTEHFGSTLAPPPFTDVHSRMRAPRCCIEGLLGARGGCQTGRGPPSSAFDGGLGCGAIGGGCSRLAPRRVPESGGRDHSTEAVSRVLFSRSGRGRPGGVPPGARGARAAAGHS